MGHIEYRVVWSEKDAHWSVHRNGADIGSSRRKKQSAVDIAILALKSESRVFDTKAIVTSIKDGVQKTEWVAS
jgi:hypothetical protein